MHKPNNKMQFFHLLMAMNYLLCATSVIAQHSFCGKIKIQAPFLIQNSSESQLLINRMVLCKSKKLYFRTTAGLYPIYSIDYTHKLLTISHVSTSSSHFVSPSKLSAGFPPSPQQNLLILYNCTNQTYPNTLRNCTDDDHLHGVEELSTTCLIVDDMEKLPTNFHPKDLNCSRYRRVFKSAALPSDDVSTVGRLGIRICFDIPNHVPSVCDECQKPGGNCGVGLRCVCHPKECKDKVISVGKKMQPSAGNILISLIYLITVISLSKCS